MARLCNVQYAHKITLRSIRLNKAVHVHVGPYLFKNLILFLREKPTAVCISIVLFFQFLKNIPVSLFFLYSSNFPTETNAYIYKLTWARAFAFLSFEEQERGKNTTGTSNP